MSKLVKFYYDLMSQPARSLWIALKLSKTPFEDCPVALRKLEQLSPEYKKVNRFQKVPAIVDGDFHLAESIAIIRYLADKGQISESLYPKELNERARVDEFLEWQHLTLRYGCSMYFMKMWLLPINGLADMPSEEKAKKLRNEMEKNLSLFEKLWLPNSQFLTSDKMRMADIYGASEIEQLRLTDYKVKNNFPKIEEWLQRVRAEANPFYDQGHNFIYKKSGTTPQ